MKVTALTALSVVALLASYGPAAAQVDPSSDQNNSAPVNPANESAEIQAEAQAMVAKSTAAAAVALTQLDQGPVTPEKVSTPAGVTVAAPAAPRAAPLPPIDLSKLPPDLQRPVTIKWNGPVGGAIAAIAQQINYTVVPSPSTPVTPPMVSLDETAKPVALVFQELGARVASYGYVNIDPNRRTVQFVVKPAPVN